MAKQPLKAAQREFYNLRWNNYFTNILQVFNELQQTDRMVDATLVCENQHIRAHKIVLSACSDFFMDIFQNMSQVHPVIVFHEIKYRHLRQIVTFLYQGEVKVQDTDLEGVLILGEKLKVKGLSSVKMKHNVPTSVKQSDRTTDIIKYEIHSPTKGVAVKKRSKIDQTGHFAFKKIKLTSPVTETKTAEVDYVDLSNCNDEQINDTSTSNKKYSINDTQEAKVDLIEHSTNNDTTDTNKEHSTIFKEAPDKKTTHENDAVNITNIKKEVLDTDRDTNPKEEAPDEKPTNVSNKVKNSSETAEQISESNSSKPIRAFILFSKDWRKKLEVEHPDENFKEISVRLSNLWKSLTAVTKETYYMAARREQLSKPLDK